MSEEPRVQLHGCEYSGTRVMTKAIQQALGFTPFVQYKHSERNPMVRHPNRLIVCKHPVAWTLSITRRPLEPNHRDPLRKSMPDPMIADLRKFVRINRPGQDWSIRHGAWMQGGGTRIFVSRHERFLVNPTEEIWRVAEWLGLPKPEAKIAVHLTSQRLSFPGETFRSERYIHEEWRTEIDDDVYYAIMNDVDPAVLSAMGYDGD